jgi:hypothetical protein
VVAINTKYYVTLLHCNKEIEVPFADVSFVAVTALSEEEHPLSERIPDA